MNHLKYLGIMETLEKIRNEYPIYSDSFDFEQKVANLFHLHIWDTCAKIQREAEMDFSTISEKEADYYKEMKAGEELREMSKEDLEKVE